MNRITRRSGVLAVALLLAAAGAADASSPPKGNYGCTYTTFSGTYYAGTLNILSKSRYSVNKKKRGRYSTRGKNIKFKTGDYKGLWKGTWLKSKSVLDGSTLYSIKLRALKDSSTPTLECTRSRK
jgi:hypothetical protein